MHAITAYRRVSVDASDDCSALRVGHGLLEPPVGSLEDWLPRAAKVPHFRSLSSSPVPVPSGSRGRRPRSDSLGESSSRKGLMSFLQSDNKDNCDAMRILLSFGEADSSAGSDTSSAPHSPASVLGARADLRKDAMPEDAASLSSPMAVEQRLMRWATRGSAARLTQPPGLMVTTQPAAESAASAVAGVQDRYHNSCGSVEGLSASVPSPRHMAADGPLDPTAAGTDMCTALSSPPPGLCSCSPETQPKPHFARTSTGSSKDDSSPGLGALMEQLQQQLHLHPLPLPLPPSTAANVPAPSRPLHGTVGHPLASVCIDRAGASPPAADSSAPDAACRARDAACYLPAGRRAASSPLPRCFDPASMMYGDHEHHLQQQVQQHQDSVQPPARLSDPRFCELGSGGRGGGKAGGGRIIGGGSLDGGARGGGQGSLLQQLVLLERGGGSCSWPGGQPGELQERRSRGGILPECTVRRGR